MDSASENDDLTSSFLQHHQTDQYLLSSGVDEDDDDSRDGSEGRHTGVLREQDRFLPIANVARLMKRSIPKTGKIAKDARECVQECVSEFVSFITSEASDRCHQEKRKTINGEDILFAMSSLGFDNYVEPLKLYLQKYREANKGDKVLGEGTSFVGEVPEVMPTEVGAVGGEVGTVTLTAPAANATPGTVVFTYDMNQVQQNPSGQNEFSIQ